MKVFLKQTSVHIEKQNGIVDSLQANLIAKARKYETKQETSYNVETERKVILKIKKNSS